MPPTLPTASEALTQTLANIAVFTAAANTLFIANATVLINNAIALGFYGIAPFITKWLDQDTIVSYFEALGYTVIIPVIPGFNFAFNPPPQIAPLRMQITWTSGAMDSFLLLEDDFLLELEDGTDFLLLE